MLVRDIFFQLQLSLALVDEKVLTLALGYIMFWTITPGHIKAGAIVGFGFLCNFDLIIHFEPLHLPGQAFPRDIDTLGQFACRKLPQGRRYPGEMPTPPLH